MSKELIHWWNPYESDTLACGIGYYTATSTRNANNVTCPKCLAFLGREAKKIYTLSDHRSGHDELLDTGDDLDKLRWLRIQMLDVMDFAEQTDDGDFVAQRVFPILDAYIKDRELVAKQAREERTEGRKCAVPGCRWNTRKVCDSFCPECRKILDERRKEKEEAANRKFLEERAAADETFWKQAQEAAETLRADPEAWAQEKKERGFGPDIPGTEQVEPGVYVSTTVESINAKKETT